MHTTIMPTLYSRVFFHEWLLSQKYLNVHSIWNYIYCICNSLYSLLPSCFAANSLHASMSLIVLVLQEPKLNFEIIFLNIPTHDSRWYILAYCPNIYDKNQKKYFLMRLFLLCQPWSPNILITILIMSLDRFYTLWVANKALFTVTRGLRSYRRQCVFIVGLKSNS